jgi:hypothetical protein
VETPINSLIQILVGLILSLLVDRAIIIKRLYNKHNSAWLTLGSPNLLGSGGASREFLRYIGLRGKARTLGDPTLIALIYIHWIIASLIMLTFCGIIYLGALSK